MIHLLFTLCLLAACGPDVSIIKQRVDADGDGYTEDVDCDDAQAEVNPSAAEICDGRDNDCDEAVDEDATDAVTWFSDVDGDGFGDPDAPIVACADPAEAVADATDCDDATSAAFPGNPERCDGVDNDCNGAVDDDPSDLTTFYVDGDGDGYGDPGTAVEACEAGSDEVTNGTDCDDDDPAVHPDADELDCTDPTDYNCDGSVGYADTDGDGVPACEDCDDSDASRAPTAAEICDEADVDEDCDGASDDDDAGVSGALTWYRDVDGDGYSTGSGTSVTQCEAPVGYAASTGDCDDYDSGANPGAAEVCDAADTDEDCDGDADDADASTDASTWTTWNRDADSDGYGDAARTVAQCESPTGYVGNDDDCDDTTATVSPDATEVCDAVDVDEDCDGLIDDDDGSVTGETTWYRDADADGYGGTTTTSACDVPSGYVATSTDCNDAVTTISPAATEVCDAADTDEDCDGLADDNDASATGETTWYRDADADGYGGTTTTSACDVPSGYVATSTDCNDAVTTISPAATEVCDAADTDEDCDGFADDNDASATGETTWYRDADADGYGGTTTTSTCDLPSGYVSTSTDCNDSVATISPAATEVCDAANTDEDCDGLADDNDASAMGETTWYRDGDADGYGGTTTTSACDLPSGYVATSTDCNDAVTTISPAATEVCDAANVDEDCDGFADDNDASATGETMWYRDADADGYGGTTTTSACDLPSGYLSTSTDCNDAVATISPAATEVCDAANVDEDCDGFADDNDASATGETTWYRDADADGYGGTTTTSTCDLPSGYVSTSTDCNDAVATISPAGTEVCDAANTDEDCDGLADDNDASVTGETTWYRDGDADGYGGTTTRSTCDVPSGYVSTSTDCNDAVATISPATAEVCDTIDNDCDTLVDDDDPGVTGGSTWYADLDLDGFGDSDDSVLACEEPAAYTDDATDCDDTDADVNPLGTELYGNTVDENCDGDTDPFTISCSGASVPGTYATLTAALAARAPVICLAAGTYTGNYTLTADAEIIGAGQGRTILTGSLSANDQDLLLSHVTVEDGITEPGGSSILQHVTATCATTSYAIYFIMVAGEDILLDSVDASCTSGYAIYAQIPADNINEVWLTVQNSWLHDSINGLYARLGGSSTSKHPYLYALNNTVTDNYFGLREMTYGATNGRARFYNANNVIYGNTYGIYQSFPISGTSADYSNALYDNGDDYAIEANPGLNDITADPLLDFAYEPPTPGAGSPLIDAGTTYYYADLDYWETTRSTTTPTIGAVER